MVKLKKHFNWLIGGSLFLMILLGVFISKNLNSQSERVTPSEPIPIVKDETMNSESEKNEKAAVSLSPIMVDVQGSVKSPGVYEMIEGDRVIDVIRKAGGLLKEAEVRSVNQAERISDEMVIYVAAKGEENAPLPANIENEKEVRLNINSANLSELQNLSGVGPSKAQSIINYREENGPFKSLDDLLEVRGIGEKTIEDWKDKIEFR